MKLTDYVHIQLQTISPVYSFTRFSKKTSKIHALKILALEECRPEKCLNLLLYHHPRAQLSLRLRQTHQPGRPCLSSRWAYLTTHSHEYQDWIPQKLKLTSTSLKRLLQWKELPHYTKSSDVLPISCQLLTISNQAEWKSTHHLQSSLPAQPLEHGSHCSVCTPKSCPSILCNLHLPCSLSPSTQWLTVYSPPWCQHISLTLDTGSLKVVPVLTDLRQPPPLLTPLNFASLWNR